MSEAAKPENERRKFRAIKGTRDILPPDSALWNWFEKTARGVMESYNFGEIRTPIFEETELFARSIGAETDVVNKEMYSFAQSNVRDLLALKAAIANFEVSDAQEKLVSFFHVAQRFQSYAGNAMADGDVALSNAPAYKELHERLDTLFRVLGENGAARGEAEKIQTVVRSFVVPEAAAETHAAGVQNLARNLAVGDGVTLRPEATASVVRAYIEHGMQMRAGDQKLYYIGPMFRRERPQKGRYRQFYQIGAEVLGTSDAPAIDAELI
ncbi:MAG TPA: ATP phosphoribosyltransferase regulatory subunit, partial [Candidatus Dormibacteraeota bacterium]|nr:ATP phosphoribosyltransferase regulatory subunit [Candidatus Dormibacteraeota bacterium]